MKLQSSILSIFLNTTTKSKLCQQQMRPLQILSQHLRTNATCTVAATKITTTTAAAATTAVGAFLQPMLGKQQQQQQQQQLHLESKQNLHQRYRSNYISKLMGILCPTKSFNQQRADELIANLRDSERAAFKVALQKYDAQLLKRGFEVEQAEEPSSTDKWKIFWVNAVPFVAFGFLDNFTMIIAGDSIEQLFSYFMCISTMAAAGLGNTISDVLGIGSASYVEKACETIGLKPPDLTPAQMDLKSSRRSANYGRIIGITAGCLIGMTPLLWMDKEGKFKKVEEEENHATN